MELCKKGERLVIKLNKYMRAKNHCLKHIQYTTWLLVIVFFFILSSCNLSENDNLQNTSDNSILIGDQPLQFVSAKITLYRPYDVTGYQSHYWAYLEFSTDPEFKTPWIANSSMIFFELKSVYTGGILPKFPLKNGDYKVTSASDMIDEEYYLGMAGKNFMYGPKIYLKHNPNDLSFGGFHDVESGTVNLTFDLSKNRVIAKHNWTTTEGLKVTGTNNLPLDLSEFTP